MKWRFKKYYLFILTICFGFLITIQLKANTSSEGIVTIQRLLDMDKDVNNVEIEINNLEKSILEHKKKLNEYEVSYNLSGSIYTSMREELSKVRYQADLEKVGGPGIIITLNDSIKDLENVEHPELYLIHDIDVLEIINELRAAGAEAISINNERIIGSTNIKCGGPTINIDGKRHATPFVIKAIGDPKVLEASVLAPDSYIDWMEYNEIIIEVEIAESIVIDEYRKDLRIDYQKIFEGGGEE